MPKFFVKSKQIDNNKVCIIGEDVNHIKNVLRKKVGDTFEVCNKDDGKNYLAKIDSIDKEIVLCNIIQELENNAESNVCIHVFQGLPKLDKMELIIQKSVELGANKINPVKMKRCVVKLNEKDEVKKLLRWHKISEVASKQCGRDIVPEIGNVINIKDICSIIQEYDLVLVAYENEKNNKLKNELKEIKRMNKKDLKIAIVIGPEGGLELSDIECLKENGAKIITLGNRILRTETVALNMISIINYELEE